MFECIEVIALAVSVGLGVTSAAMLLLQRESRSLRWVLLAFSVVVLVRYLIWRGSHTIAGTEWSVFTVFEYGFYGLELLLGYDLIQGIRRSTRSRKTNRSRDADENADWYASALPRIDLLVPTHSEPWPVLERTVIGAKNQDYPNCAVWLLDDGDREWLRKRAQEHGVGYITRTRKAHAKAGNLNHALHWLREQGKEPEFIALLDADFVAQRSFLSRTLALMADTKVGIVQTPQWYYNEDPFQQRFGGVAAWPDDMRWWFDELQPRRDDSGSSLCAGTSCLIRVRALVDIGGFPTDSVSEDTLCSMRMARAGWLTRYLNERLSSGLAPEGLSEYLNQRERWQYGWLELSRLNGPPKKLIDRLHGWLFTWYKALSGTYHLCWFGVAIICLFTGHWVLRASAVEVLSYMAPLWVRQRFFISMLGGRNLPVVIQAHRIAQLPMQWMVTLGKAVLNRRVPFNVTQKGKRDNRVRIHWSSFRWYAPLPLVLLCGMAYALATFDAGETAPDVFMMNLALSFFLLLQGLGVVFLAIERGERRVDHRFRTAESVLLSDDTRQVACRCRDISVGGLLLAIPPAAPPPLSSTVTLSDLHPMRVRRVRAQGGGLATYAFVDEADRADLIRRIYCTDRYLPHVDRWSSFRAWAGLASGTVRALCRFTAWVVTYSSKRLLKNGRAQG